MSDAARNEGWERQLLDDMNDLVVIFSYKTGVIQDVNEDALRELGWHRSDVIGHPIREFVHADDHQRLGAVAADVKTGVMSRSEQRWKSQNGTWRPYDVFARLIDNERLVACGRDRSQLMNSLEENQDLLRLVELTDDILVVTNADGSVRYCNPAVNVVHGLPPDEAVGRSIAEFVADDGRHLYHKLVSDAWANGNRANARIPSHRKDGTTVYLDVHTVRDPETGRWYTVERDITEATAQQEQLEQLNRELLTAATIDHLTGLTNRAVFTRELGDALNNGEPLALFLLDIDNFKLINDTLGHAYGDELLRSIANRLRAYCREGDTVGRFGGDEFLLLIRGMEDGAQAMRRVEELRSQLSGTYLIEGRELHVSCSIGVALPASSSTDTGELFRDADIAAYKAKDLGRNRSVLFDAVLEQEVRHRFELEADLRTAVAEDQLAVAFQGIFEPSSRELIGFEALVRWNHPVRGLVLPNDFIDVAEDCGLLNDISEMILTKSLEHSAEWLRDGNRFLSVNCAPSQLINGEAIDRLLTTLDRFNLGTEKIIVEITEVGLTGALDKAGKNLLRLREAGFQLAIDDFGKGASSLGYLRDLPITTVKIDGSFVHELTTDRSVATITASVIELAERLGLTAVAECVETEDQLQVLIDMACHRVQGDLLHRPSPPEEIEMLKAGRPARPTTG